MAEVVFLGFRISTYAMRVRIALEEKGIAYEYVEEVLSNKSPLLLKSNPIHKQVPVLIHNGKPVCESLVILEYIDEVWRNKCPFLPSKPMERANARFWADYIDKKVFAAGRAMVATTGEAQEAVKKQLIEGFMHLEAELGDKTYFGGDHFGYVDAVLAPLYCSFYAVENGEKSMMAQVCPKLMAWFERISQRDSVVKALPTPEEVLDFLAVLRKKSGNR